MLLPVVDNPTWAASNPDFPILSNDMMCSLYLINGSRRQNLTGRHAVPG